MKIDVTELRVVMAKSNINQKELSHLAGIREATISSIINNKSNGTPSTWAKIAKALNVNELDIIKIDQE